MSPEDQVKVMIERIENATFSEEIFLPLSKIAIDMCCMNKIHNVEYERRQTILKFGWKKISRRLPIQDLKLVAYKLIASTIFFHEKNRYSQKPIPASDSNLVRTDEERQFLYDLFHGKARPNEKLKKKSPNILALDQAYVGTFLKDKHVRGFAIRTYELYYGMGFGSFSKRFDEKGNYKHEKNDGSLLDAEIYKVGFTFDNLQTTYNADEIKLIGKAVKAKKIAAKRKK